MIGTSISQYRILEKLGEGGMGIVYKARDTKLDRFVAVKVLPLERVADAGRKSRFVQEAKAASALNHPGIITIHDIISHDSGECIVMELVEGNSLSQLIAKKELRLREILKISAQIAEAIAVAHATGIIHRDLKPSNIMVTDSGLVKILDFGLAKLTTEPAKGEGPTMTLPRTDPEMVIGTPGYMSPEQVRGQKLDSRSDIFNFGLILYEMLSGVRAFQGDTSIDVMSSILKEPPADLPESVPAALRQIVAVCLEKNPSNRFESARDIGFALKALTAGTSISSALPKVEAAEKRGLSIRPLLLALAAVSIAAIVVVALFFFRQPESLDLSSYQFYPIATEAEHEGNGVWSPDGKSIAYIKRISRQYLLMYRSMEASMPIPLTDPTLKAWRICDWSPDGSRIFFLGNGLLSVATSGGEPHQILPPKIDSATLSPDGETLAFWKASEEDGKRTASLWITTPEGSTPRRYEPSPFLTQGSFVPVFLEFSPDGSHIVLSKYSSEGGAELWLLDWPDGQKAKPRRIFTNRSLENPPDFSWFPDSRHLLLAIDGTLWQGDIKTGRVERVTSSIVAEHVAPSVSPDGRQILMDASSDTYDIIRIPLDGSSARPLIVTSLDERSPSWSSSKDLMTYITSRSGEEEIWLRSLEGDWERPIVRQNDFPDESVRFNVASISPDGTRVAYSISWSGSPACIWISPISGGNPVKATTGDDQLEYAFSWSPDGSSIACCASSVAVDVRGHLDIIRVGSQMPPEKIPCPEGIWIISPAWSPDGQWIAFGNYPDQSIVLVSPKGKETRSIPFPVMPTGQDFFLVWSQDSSSIYVASSSGEESVLYEVNARTGDYTKIVDLGTDIYFQSPTNLCVSGSLAPDGKSITTSVNVFTSDLWILEGFPQPGRRRSR